MPIQLPPEAPVLQEGELHEPWEQEVQEELSIRPVESHTAAMLALMPWEPGAKHRESVYAVQSQSVKQSLAVTLCITQKFDAGVVPWDPMPRDLQATRRARLTNRMTMVTMHVVQMRSFRHQCQKSMFSQ
mmetsp:Transcript_77143/g.218307  ORF Transcript_77143/g.218307 Transcript_77143/m.218307 type:complete len:130 (+) Transcript_77143:1862-2251(+)